MKILIVTAHPDDCEFSIGATLAKLSRLDNEIKIHVFSTSDTIEGNEGIVKESERSIHGIYNLDLNLHKYPTMHFIEHYQEIRDDIFRIKQEFHPDVVYCKSPKSIHPDHRVIGEACESIFLESTIYGMESIRDGHNQHINKWVEVSEEDLDVKISAIMCYKSQSRRGYRNSELIKSIARMRGNQVGRKFAEGFEVIRDVS